MQHGQFVKGYGVVKVNSSMGSNFEGSDDQGDPRNSTSTTTNLELDRGGIMVLAPHVGSHSLQEGLSSMSSWSRTRSTKTEAEVPIHL